MANHDEQTSATAIRDAVESDLAVTSPSAQICLQRIEHVLFERRALAPAAAISIRVIDLLRKNGNGRELPDVELLSAHDDLCTRLAADFAKDADCWQDSITSEFRSRAAVAFGVEESSVPTLFREFHVLPEAQRLGIFLAIEQAPLFSYLTREIDEYTGDASVDNPTASLRGLMAIVFAGQ